MISKLKIQNLILIEFSEITFGPGLNILTGETGSGKSAILTAIRLILGQRADVDWIRKGADLSIVEAVIGGRLVRREVHRSGRSRSFIDDELVTLQELKALPVQLVDQGASLHLSEEAHQREFLDLFGGISGCTSEYRAWRENKDILEELLALQKTGEVEQKRIAEDLLFIEEIGWKSGEEENLQKEHHLLTHAAEILDKANLINRALFESLPQLKRVRFDGLLKIEPKFGECAEWFKTGILNLEEVGHYLTSYLSKIEVDQNRLTAIEKRIGEIDSVKRRFGTFEQVEKFVQSSNKFSNLEEEIDRAKKEVNEAESALLKKTAQVSSERKKAAIAFEKALLKELHSLNLPDARISIDIQPKSPSEFGADEIRYLFAANPGQPLQTLDKAPSGGELSRLLFSLKTILGNREKNSCLIFDEIDSNIGGKTAAIFGLKLKTLSEHLQLICVTHFVQVAKCALDHFLVSKKTTPDGAFTLIERLTEKARTAEFDRMMGTR